MMARPVDSLRQVQTSRNVQELERVEKLRIMSFADAPSSRSVPVCADRGGRMMNQQQQFAIDYLREENRVLREQLGDRRLRLNDDQRRRLAAKAKRLGRRVLAE